MEKECSINPQEWEKKFELEVSKTNIMNDPAHDLLHIKRVVSLAKKLCEKEGGDFSIVVPAAWLHDLIIVPKNSQQRHEASRLSAVKAIEFLKSIDYPSEHLGEISHAIEAHSFSANIEVSTINAKIVQDADRLDGLGSIGIARCFATAGFINRPLYNPEDPFCELRPPDDLRFTIDHFFQKLFKTAETLKTKTGFEEGERRVGVMKSFLYSLRSEL